jgi:hypothetical protein
MHICVHTSQTVAALTSASLRLCAVYVCVRKQNAVHAAVCTSSFRTMTFGAYRAFQAWARSTRAVRNHFFLLMLVRRRRGWPEINRNLPVPRRRGWPEIHRNPPVRRRRGWPEIHRNPPVRRRRGWPEIHRNPPVRRRRGWPEINRNIPVHRRSGPPVHRRKGLPEPQNHSLYQWIGSADPQILSLVRHQRGWSEIQRNPVVRRRSGPPVLRRSGPPVHRRKGLPEPQNHSLYQWIGSADPQILSLVRHQRGWSEIQRNPVVRRRSGPPVLRRSGPPVLRRSGPPVRHR